MSLFSRVLGSLPKRLVAGAAIALAVMLPVAVSAAQTVSIEAETGVANVTAGDTAYKTSVAATYDQVVKVQVTYNNKEEAGSGKVAQNLRVKINVPTQAGKTQNIATTTSADNSNTVNGKVTVNLDRADAYLQYIPGSAVWKHAKSANSSDVEQKIVSDAVVTSANGLVLENENPCQAGSVTVLARVMVPGVKIVKESQVKGGTSGWSNDNTAKSGDTLKYLITYQNTGNTTQNDVVIRDSLPPHMKLVPGSTKFANATYPQGKAATSDDVVNGGIIIGNYAPGANAYVTFEVKIDEASKLACGENEFRNVGVARPKSMNEYYNTAITKVTRECEETQPKAPICTGVTIAKKAGRQIVVDVTYKANGATLKQVTYNFGDKSTPLTTDKTHVTYAYAKDGKYSVTTALLFSVDGKDKLVRSDNCTQTVSFTTPGTPPSTPELPNTGAGNVLGLFAGASVAGGLGYRMFLTRRLTRN